MSERTSSLSLLTSSLRRWVSTHLPVFEGDVLVPEMCFFGRKNRADLVLANGALTAFEIKSSSDRMSRWPDQQAAYLEVFDKVWLCVHNKHLEKAYQDLSPFVGLMVSDDYGGVVVLREAKANKSQSLPRLAELLWRPEIDSLLLGAGEKLNRSMRIAEAREEMLSKIPEEGVREAVIMAIKNRYLDHQLSSSSEGGVVLDAGNP